MNYNDKKKAIKQEMFSRTPTINTQELFQKASTFIQMDSAPAPKNRFPAVYRVVYIGLLFLFLGLGGVWVANRNTHPESSDEHFSFIETNEELYGFFVRSMVQLIINKEREITLEEDSIITPSLLIVAEMERLNMFFPLIEATIGGVYVNVAFQQPSDKEDYDAVIYLDNGFEDNAVERIYYKEQFLASGDIEIQFLAITKTREFTMLGMKNLNKNPKEFILQANLEDDQNYIRLIAYPYQQIAYFLIDVVENNMVKYRNSFEYFTSNDTIEVKTIDATTIQTTFTVGLKSNRLIVSYLINQLISPEASYGDEEPRNSPSSEEGTIAVYQVESEDFVGYYFDIQSEEIDFRMISSD